MKYLDQTLSFRERAEDLVEQMTLEEKVSQLTYRAAPIERLGIPAYNWWNEALHGVARAGTATVFPQAIAMAAMFDTEQIYKIADIISTEGRAKYNAYSSEGDRDIYKGLTFWAPNVNIFRDPRWGRGHETYGEDPYLTSRLAVEFIRGLQGDDPKYLKTAACAKHFAVHSGPEAERHEFNAEVGQKDLWETYLPAFEACVTEAGVEAVMGAYNRTNGEPCCAHSVLMEEILRGKWNFQGHYVSDCFALADFHEKHHVTNTPVESAALALKKGCDVNCGNMFLYLLTALKEGLVTQEEIDRAVIRLMTTRIKLGMFDRVEKFDHITYDRNDSPEHKKENISAARKAMTLLKNDGLLPLNKKNIKKGIAVIGPNADSRIMLPGNYHGTASQYVTILDGIQNHVGDDIHVYYSEGCDMFLEHVERRGNAGDRIAEAVVAAKYSDVAIVCLGMNEKMEGEQFHESNEYGAGDKSDLELPGEQLKLLKAVRATGVPTILLLCAGSAMAVGWADENVNAVVDVWYPGAQGGKAVAELLFGDYSPAGRLPITFYRTTEELPDFRDYNMKGRTYRYMENEPLYPFGYGLSYTTFDYSALKLSSNEVKNGEKVIAEITVKNTGNTDSDEVAELYIRDDLASVRVPKYSLCGFKRIHLKAGESKTVSMTIEPDSMRIVDDSGNRFIENGSFTVYMGGSAPDPRSCRLLGKAPLQASFTVA